MGKKQIEYTIMIVWIFKYSTFEKHTVSCSLDFWKKITSLAGSRWPLLIRIHILLQINWFPLIYVNLRVKSVYRINEIMGCFFCRDSSSIYSKCFCGNFRIISQIYKCEAYTEPFNFTNELLILNKLFITFFSNMLNPGKLSSCAWTEFW